MPRCPRGRVPWSALRGLTALAMALALGQGCAGPGPIPSEVVVTGDGYARELAPRPHAGAEFEAIPVAGVATEAGLVQRVASVRVLVDDSAEMASVVPGTAELTRSVLAARLVARLHETLAGAGMPSDVQRLTQEDLAADLMRQSPALRATDAPMALVVFTRWDRLDAHVEAVAKRLHHAFGPKLCSYWIGVGDRLACPRALAVDACGFARPAVELASPAGLHRFAREAFYAEPRDRDEDGIADVRDRCPDTRARVRVDWDGCPWQDQAPERPVLLNGQSRLAVVYFAPGRAALTGLAQDRLDRICARLAGRGQGRMQLRAHTDSQAAADANHRLAQQRGQAVSDYLASCGIETAPSIAALGEAEPRADNGSAYGRARNRRVEVWYGPVD